MTARSIGRWKLPQPTDLKEEKDFYFIFIIPFPLIQRVEGHKVCDLFPNIQRHIKD